jgi:hypothetical protein
MEHSGSKCLVKVHHPFSQVAFCVCSHRGLDQDGSLQVIKLLIWLEFVVLCVKNFVNCHILLHYYQIHIMLFCIRNSVPIDH